MRSVPERAGVPGHNDLEGDSTAAGRAEVCPLTATQGCTGLGHPSAAGWGEKQCFLAIKIHTAEE